MSMSASTAETRTRIVQSAARLFYEQGYNRTSFTDIARVAGLPRGNFYYHFRSKDAILEAVLRARREGVEAQLAQWRREQAAPRARLQRFLDMLAEREPELVRYGCPLGTLSQELGKTHRAHQRAARALFEPFLDWLAEAFAELGHGAQARALAMHLVASAQGASQMAHVFGDAGVLRDEIRCLERWLDRL